MRYRTVPREVEAMRWTGENFSEIAVFLKQGDANYSWGTVGDTELLSVKTVSGQMALVPVGSYVVFDVDGFPYPCKESIFEKTYEAVE